ncbi:unnamed protein product [Gadus morhua 'NCC']
MVGRGSSGSCLEGERGETQAKTGPTLPPKPRAPDRCIAACWTRGHQWHTCAGWIPAGPPDRGPRARPTAEDHAMPTGLLKMLPLLGWETGAVLRADGFQANRLGSAI